MNEELKALNLAIEQYKARKKLIESQIAEAKADRK